MVIQRHARASIQLHFCELAIFMTQQYPSLQENVFPILHPTNDINKNSLEKYFKFCVNICEVYFW